MILTFVAYTWVFYGLFLIYCTLRRAHLNGRLAKAPLLVRCVCYTYLGPGVLMDWFFNMTFGAASFVEWPWKYGLKSLFTERCSQHMKDTNWRGSYARWVCFGWLNLFDDNHCH